MEGGWQGFGRSKWDVPAVETDGSGRGEAWTMTVLLSSLRVGDARFVPARGISRATVPLDPIAGGFRWAA
ncbi:MAG: hypothetical protein B9S38_00830 [Verrucomicrobiia bacterium Tous-C4TDCM]|jgi:hypothetical protein|nr:MAG: hypothetical protein B9S38_00830 [Verrucomicrobiae bacterium Tous-C4TDCM]